MSCYMICARAVKGGKFIAEPGELRYLKVPDSAAEGLVSHEIDVREWMKEVRDLAGMDLSKLEPAYTITERSTGNGGLVVVHNGWLCFERTSGSDRSRLPLSQVPYDWERLSDDELAGLRRTEIGRAHV